MIRTSVHSAAPHSAVQHCTPQRAQHAQRPSRPAACRTFWYSLMRVSTPSCVANW